SLTGTLTIPSSITSIGEYAFATLSSLQSIIALNPVPLTNLGELAFWGDNNIKYLYVPCSSIPAYQSASQWNSFTVVGDDKFVNITSSADTVKYGTRVTFTADTSCLNKPVTLHWQVNGKPEGAGYGTFSYVPVNGDIISCNAVFTDTSATSNAIVMFVSCNPNMNIAVTTPGTLNTLIGSCSSTVTNLTLSGTIDARDFKTMRDSMPVLTVLDLSQTAIAAYTG